MRTIVGMGLGLVLAGTVAAQPPADPPLDDARLSIHTLVREDIFAGFIDGDLERMARGEASIEQLLRVRTAERGSLIAWKGGTQIRRAVAAREAGDETAYARLFAAGLATFEEARATDPADGGVAAVTGGTFMLFADRLAPEHRARAWEMAYGAYNGMWAEQGPIAKNLPVHHRGELAAGLVQTAQRTGRAAEADERLAAVLSLVAGTPYEADLLRWKAEPQARASMNLACKNCHEDGRLSATLARMKG